MTNNEFWKSYVAKCSEKGLPPRYESAEEFAKAMNEPPKPYSTDDFAPKRDIEEWHAFEEGVDNIDVGDLEDFEQVAEDAKKRRKEGDVKKVEWKRCAECNEMKADSEFKSFRGGKIGNVCKICAGKKVRAGKKTKEEIATPPIPKIVRAKDVELFMDEGELAFLESKPLSLPEDACDAADALRFALHVKEETPLLKEAKPLLAMSAEAFEAAILFAYEKGKEDAEVLDVEEITPIGAESFAMRAILRLKEGA
jgi:hypothetical protein